MFRLSTRYFFDPETKILYKTEKLFCRPAFRTLLPGEANAMLEMGIEEHTTATSQQGEHADCESHDF